MPIIVDQVKQSTPGEEFLVGSQSEDGRAAVVFEDDGKRDIFTPARP
jgi:hypothetical protein